MKENIKKILSLLLALTLCFGLIPNVTAEAASTSLSKTTATIYVGNSTTLKVTGTKKKVTWTTSNKKVAIVKNGKVTGIKAGEATITAKVGSKKYTCNVTVKNPELSQKTLAMETGDKATLELKGVKKGITWKSSNTKVAKVKNGKVTALAKGTAKITASYKGKKYTCQVTVTKAVKKVQVKIDKQFSEDEMSKAMIEPLLSQLTIKGQTTKGKYVVYTVTESSYKKLIDSIKKQIDTDIKTILVCQKIYTNITYNSKYTQFKFYVDVEEMNKAEQAEMPEADMEKLMDAIFSMTFNATYYQIFHGTLADNIKVDTLFYDNKTNVEIPMY